MSVDERWFGPEGDLSLREEVERIRDYIKEPLPTPKTISWCLVMEERLPRLQKSLDRLAKELYEMETISR